MSPADPDDRDRTREPELPTSLVPRWLALLVLVALLASAGFSVWALVSVDGRAPAASAERRAP